MRTHVVAATLTLSVALVSVTSAAVQPPPKAAKWPSNLAAASGGPPATI